MVIFKKKSCGGAKALLMVLTLFFGGLLALESRYAVFRINNIKTSYQQIVKTRVMWDIISPAEERFWPLFFINTREHEKKLEKFYPVKVKIKLDSWGAFRIELVNLSPIFKMYWGDKYWYISDSGMAWLNSLPENQCLSLKNAEEKPLLIWNSDRQLPLDLVSENGNIIKTSLNITKINEWYSKLEALGWMHNIKFVIASMDKKKPVVNIVFKNKDGVGVTLQLKDDPSTWIEVGLAIKKIYPDLTILTPEVFIDTTYENKILIKNIKNNQKGATK
ncbi:MAG: hypothetical protein RRZ70_02985 [Synergistaceae bacterium]